MIRCTFAGHRDVCGVQAEDITEVLEEIIQFVLIQLSIMMLFVRGGSAIAEKTIQGKGNIFDSCIAVSAKKNQCEFGVL